MKTMWTCTVLNRWRDAIPGMLRRNRGRRMSWRLESVTRRNHRRIFSKLMSGFACNSLLLHQPAAAQLQIQYSSDSTEENWAVSNIRALVMCWSLPLHVEEHVSVLPDVPRRLRPAGSSDAGVTASQPSGSGEVTDVTDVVPYTQRSCSVMLNETTEATEEALTTIQAAAQMRHDSSESVLSAAAAVWGFHLFNTNTDYYIRLLHSRCLLFYCSVIHTVIISLVLSSYLIIVLSL